MKNIRRGEKALDNLKELALYKMNLPENVAKGWPNLTKHPHWARSYLTTLFESLTEEVEELREEVKKSLHSDNIEALRFEIADIAAYCAILLDLITQTEKTSECKDM